MYVPSIYKSGIMMYSKMNDISSYNTLKNDTSQNDTLQRQSYIVDFFHNHIGHIHPIWFLRGDRALSLRIAQKMVEIDCISESRTFDFNSSASIDEFHRFTLHYPTMYRTCICMIGPASPKLSSLLKIIEEPPTKTYIIIIGTDLPAMHMNRIGFVHDIHINIDNSKDDILQILHKAPNIEISDFTIYHHNETEAVLKIIHALMQQIRDDQCRFDRVIHDSYDNIDSTKHKCSFSAYNAEKHYKILLNIIDVYYYLNSGKLTPNESLQMCIELINVGKELS